MNDELLKAMDKRLCKLIFSGRFNDETCSMIRGRMEFRFGPDKVKEYLSVVRGDVQKVLTTEKEE